MYQSIYLSGPRPYLESADEDGLLNALDPGLDERTEPGLIKSSDEPDLSKNALLTGLKGQTGEN